MPEPIRKSTKKSPTGKLLTAKERKFCEELIVDGNGRQAAIRAGYSQNSATEIASENLSKPHIKAYYKALLSAQAARLKVTGDKVINELAAIAFFKVTEIIDVVDVVTEKNGVRSSRTTVKIKPSKDWSKIAERAVESIKIDKDGAIAVKAHGKVSALTKLGEHFGMFTDYNVAIAALSRYGYVTELPNGEKGFEFHENLPGEAEPSDELDAE